MVRRLSEILLIQMCQTIKFLVGMWRATDQDLSKKMPLSSSIISFKFDEQKIQYLIDDLLISENEFLILVGNPLQNLEVLKK